ncbi:MAG: hypothetical protein V3T99_05285, partial [Nitrososphaerales archaeon]
PQVSHCYQRPVYPDWPYNVFSMIHCKSQEEASDVAKEIQNQINVLLGLPRRRSQPPRY